MAHPIADIFHQAAALNRACPLRQGNTLHLGAPPRVVIAGDIHGHRQYFAKILAHANAGPIKAMLILQEIIHGPPDEKTGLDRSIELMLRAARLKIASPENVHILMGNHDLAQFNEGEITKEGHRCCQGFSQAMQGQFGPAADEVRGAVYEYCRSKPLAARFANGVQASHSLPSPSRAELGGTEILGRDTTQADLKRGKPLYEWLWGRDQTPEQLEALAEKTQTTFFVLGHRHLPGGRLDLPNRAVAICCNQPAGYLFEFAGDSDVRYETRDSFLRPLAKL